MIEFWSVENVDLWIGLGLAVINAVLLCFEGYKFMQIIQLSGYHIRGYFDWLKNTRAKHFVRLVMLALLSSAAMIVTNAIFNAHLDYLAYIGLIVYFALSIFFIKNVYSAPKKTPLKMTNRMTRSMILLFVVNFIVSFGLIILSSMFIDIYRFGAVALTPIVLPVIVPFVHWIMKPIENMINKKYIYQARKKLKDYPKLIKIGITGSYGKTSVKNFLYTILSEKYNVCVTPMNYNTPMGITKTVIQFLSPGHQVLIAEMGARQLGDIKELCEIVEPKYGIVTSIAEQHLATFKTVENIVKTKSELPEYLGESGFCVFNIDDSTISSIYKKFKCEKTCVSILNNSNASVWADNIVTTTDGTDFSLHIEKEKIDCHTKLLGKHNISNLVMCVPLALKLGLSVEQIKKGIEKLNSVEHRLQMIKAENDVTILDDAYNASIEGSTQALEVLSMFKDRRKIIITPGLVELGKIERLANYEFGERMASVADLVVIVNKQHYLSIRQGLLDKNFDENKILQAQTFQDAQKIISELIMKGDIILWENDLPDNYT